MPGVENSTSIQLKQQQTHLLSQWQHASLELLQLPLAALESRLLYELTNNPALEEAPPERSEMPEDDYPSAPADDGDENDENLMAERFAQAESWSDELPLPPERSSRTAEGEYLDLIGNSAAPPPDLTEQLMVELAAVDLSPEIYQVAAEIISALDEDGYLSSNPADLAMVCDVDLPVVLEALEFVQEIAPAGVAARDLAECLTLQLKRQGALTPQLEALLADGLEDIERNRLPRLAAKLQVPMEELESMLALLRRLDPAPGRRFVAPAGSVIHPELEIVAAPDGSFKVVPLRDSCRRIIVSPYYEKLYNDPGLSGDDRKYLEEKLLRARELVKSLYMRDSTLLQLGQVIAGHQQEFLRHGVTALRPMTMHEAGELLEVQESTVSRAVADKYIRTPQGVFPLKFFFSTGYSTGDGEAFSSHAVMERIRQLISAEDPAAPLSDDRIAAELKKMEFNVARRTVAKYREQLKIPASSLRKKYS